MTGALMIVCTGWDSIGARSKHAIAQIPIGQNADHRSGISSRHSKNACLAARHNLGCFANGGIHVAQEKLMGKVFQRLIHKKKFALQFPKQRIAFFLRPLLNGFIFHNSVVVSCRSRLILERQQRNGDK